MILQPGQRGSAAVEFALVMPLVLASALALIQVGLVARDALVVAHAAREGAREAAVTTEDDVVRDVVLDRGGLSSERTTVDIDRSGTAGDAVTVRISYRAPLIVPFVDWLLPGGVALRGVATMRQEDVTEPW